MLAALAAALVASAAYYGLLLVRQIRGELQQREKLVSQLAQAAARDAASKIALTRQALELRKLSAVAELTGNAVAITDPQGRIEWVNRSFERLTGYTLAEVQGRRPGELLHGPGTDDGTRARVRAALAAAEPIEFEILNYARDGREYWVRIDVRPVRDDAGHVSHFLSVQTDVSAQKAVEGELLRARDLAMAAAHARGQFIANTSHEIRTPMNGILGMTELLLRSRLDERQRRQAECILRSGRHLLALLNDVLDISKMEAGRFELNSQSADLAQLAREVLATLKESAAGKSLALEFTLEPATLPPLVFDPLRLRQVLANLLGNAVKFTTHGSVALEIRATPAAAGSRVAFAVRDTGPGIPPDLQHHIFEPFVQGDARIAAAHGGTGLGLTISREIVRTMGGELGVTSTPGAGSCFAFELTLPVGVLPAAPDAPEPLRRLGLRVLIAEDYAPNRGVLVELLDALGCVAVAVADGRAAVERYTAAADVFDVILMDCRMPVMDGFEATVAIRAWERGAARPAVPIVAITAGAFELQRRECFEAGMTGFVAKPVTLADLQRALGAIADAPRADRKAALALPLTPSARTPSAA